VASNSESASSARSPLLPERTGRRAYGFRRLEVQPPPMATCCPSTTAPGFTFRFADDRIIPRLHLEGVPLGSQISVIKIDPETGQRLNLLTTATVGANGWVELPESIIVRAGEAFIAVPVMTDAADTHFQSFPLGIEALVDGEEVSRKTDLEGSPVPVLKDFVHEIEVSTAKGLMAP
jgi:hypothetical protein